MNNKNYIKGKSKREKSQKQQASLKNNFQMNVIIYRHNLNNNNNNIRDPKTCCKMLKNACSNSNK